MALLPVHGGERFELFGRPIEIPEAGTVTARVLITDHHQFTFLPPQSAIVTPDAATRSVAMGCPGGLALHLWVRPSFAKEAPALDPEALRTTLLSSNPSYRIVEQFACYAAAAEGIAFDLISASNADALTSVRIAFLPYSGGTLEVSMSTPAIDIGMYHGHWTRLLNSLEIEIVRR